MKLNKHLFVVSIAVCAAFAPLSSCTNFDTRAKNDAATGALIGAGAGALLSDDNRAGGALIGGAVGGGAGYLYGRSRE